MNINSNSFSRPMMPKPPIRKERPGLACQVAEATGKTLSTPFITGSIGAVVPCRMALEGIRARHSQPAADRQEWLGRFRTDACDVAFAGALSAAAFPLGFCVGLVAMSIVAREEFGSIQFER